MISNDAIKDNKLFLFVQNIFSYRITRIISFSILTAIAAQIAIPVKPVPFSLQTMIVFLAGAILGAKDGFYSQAIYLGLGALGLPVFAQVPDAPLGLMRIIGPTGGYLLAFPFAAYLTGVLISSSSNSYRVFLSMFLASLFILLSGSLFLGVFYLNDVVEGLKSGAAIFSVWDLVKVSIAAGIFKALKK